LLLFRELDEVLGLHDIAGRLLMDTRTGQNRLHSLVGLLRQSVFGRLAEYDDVNDADRLALDPVMRQVVGGRAVDAKAASASQMLRFETEMLATADNRAALADLPGHWIDRVHNRKPPKCITLDMDSSVSVTHGAQEDIGWNGHFDCMCNHPLFVFNQFGHLERCALRPGNVHSADGWEVVPKPVIARYADRHLMQFFGGVLRSPFQSYTELWKRKTISRPSTSGPTVFSRARLASTQAPSRSSAQRREAYPRRLRVSGGVMGQASPCCRQGRVASWRIVPPHRFRCHQPVYGTRLDHPVLQPAR
jgi:hypothetical protein